MKWYYILIVILIYKVTLNLIRCIQCLDFLKDYNEYIKKPNWNLIENKHKVKSLIENAGIYNIYKTTLTDFPDIHDNDKARTNRMLHEAMGIYRSRIYEIFSPRFWVDFIIFLPTKILSYLNLNTDTFLTKLGQVIYWIMAPYLILFRTNFLMMIKHSLMLIIHTN